MNPKSHKKKLPNVLLLGFIVFVAFDCKYSMETSLLKGNFFSILAHLTKFPFPAIA